MKGIDIMEIMKYILISDVERLKEIKEDILSAICLISDSNMEMTSCEHGEMRQISNSLYNFSETLQAIIDRKEDKIQVLNADDVNLQQAELQSQIYNQE